MVKFDLYKESGFPDIAEVPFEWTMGTVKNIFDVICGATPSEQEENWGGEIPWVGPADMPMFGRISSGKRNITKTGYSSCGTTIVPAGSIVLSTRAPIGKICIANNELCTNQGCKCLVPRGNCNTQFYAYYLFAILERLQMAGTGTTFKELSTASLKKMPIPIISLSEQDKIVSFLDLRVREIDAIISEAKASIEEYKQWKASIIYEAVTKGLDPDAELVDSGVGWIGNIPKGWHVCKTLYALAMPITDGPHTTPDLFDEGIPFVSAEAVSCGNGKIAFDHIRGYISEEFYDECCLKYIPQREDIYMIKSGATTGKVSYVDTDIKFTIWSPLAVFRVNKEKMFFKYLFYFLQSDAYQKQVQIGWTYGTQQNIGMRTLETLKICMPSLPEQHAIADALDEKCDIIDSLVSEKEALISDLEAYKKSLIFEVVTGKRKVV